MTEPAIPSDQEIRAFVAQFITAHPTASGFDLQAAWRARRRNEVMPAEAARVLHFYRELEPPPETIQAGRPRYWFKALSPEKKRS